MCLCVSIVISPSSGKLKKNVRTVTAPPIPTTIRQSQRSIVVFNFAILYYETKHNYSHCSLFGFKINQLIL